MKNSPQLEQLSRQLAAEGLPASYVVRIVTELQDHQADIDDNQIDGCSRQLGDPAHLQTSIVEQYRERTLAGRHPVATIIIGSILAIPACCAGYVLIVVGSTALVLAALGVDPVASAAPEWSLAVAFCVFQAGAVIPYLGAAGLLSRFVVHSGRGLRWLLAGTAVQIIVVLLTSISFHLEPGSHATVTIGTVPAAAVAPAFTVVTQVCSQIAMPLLVAFAVWDRCFRFSSPRLTT